MRLKWILAASLFTAPSFADEYHYKNLLVGTKAIGLGGAFTAISDDLSAVFYNPAGLTNTKSSNSASISTFAWEKSTYRDVFSNGDDFSRSSFNIVPSFLGIGDNKDGFYWSIGFAVSDMSTERNYAETEGPLLDQAGNTVGKLYEFGNIDLDNSSFDLALGAALEMTSNLSMGASLIFKYKNFETVQGSGVNTVINLPEIDLYNGFTASRRIKDETIMMSPTFGILYHTDAYNVGVKFSKDFTVNRDFSATHNIFVNSLEPLPPGTRPATIGTIRGTEQQDFADMISVGFARKFGNLEWSFDIDYFSSVEVKEFSISDFHPPITRDIKQVTNYSSGVTYYTSSTSYFRFGIFTDNSNGEIDTSQPYQRTEDIDMLGVSFDYTSETFGFPMSIGAYVKYGEGDIRLSDIRVVENIVGVPLYPPRSDFDISSATKSLTVIFISANF